MATPASNYVYAFNGWLFGGPGQGVQVLAVDGLEDLPLLRTQDESRGYADGMLTGRDFLGGRTVTMTLQIMSDASASMQTYLQQVKTYLVSQSNGLGLLQLYLPGRSVQRLSARVRRRAIRIDPEYTYGRATAVVEFFCPDPRIYNDLVASAYCVANSGTVRGYDRVYALTYAGASSAPVTASVSNAGNYETGLLLSLVPGASGCTAPLIQNVGTGQVLSFPSLVMASTDTLTINTDLRIVTLTGASARSALSNNSSWFNLPAASTVTLALSAASGSPSLSVQARDAYI